MDENTCVVMYICILEIKLKFNKLNKVLTAAQDLWSRVANLNCSIYLKLHFGKNLAFIKPGLLEYGLMAFKNVF